VCDVFNSVLMQSVGGPVMKKAKIGIVEPVAADKVSNAEKQKTTNLTREYACIMILLGLCCSVRWYDQVTVC